MAVVVMLTSGNVLNKAIWMEYVFGTSTQPALLPLQVFGENIIDLGTYVLLTGGILGMVSLMFPRD